MKNKIINAKSGKIFNVSLPNITFLVAFLLLFLGAFGFLFYKIPAIGLLAFLAINIFVTIWINGKITDTYSYRIGDRISWGHYKNTPSLDREEIVILIIYLIWCVYSILGLLISGMVGLSTKFDEMSDGFKLMDASLIVMYAGMFVISVIVGLVCNLSAFRFWFETVVVKIDND